MAEKQSIFGRVAQLAKANINALLDRAEDPQKMLDQLIRDYTNSIVEAQNAIAQTVGDLRLAEKDYEEDVAAAADWGRKAEAASDKADELRAAGDAAGADKWDGLARVALGKQLQYEREAADAKPRIEAQNAMADKLKTGLATMKDKLEQLKSKRDELVARQHSAEAQTKLNDAIGSINVMDPTSELSRYEDRVRRVEAMAQGQAEVAAASLEDQFAELAADEVDVDLEARFAALKAKN